MLERGGYEGGLVITEIRGEQTSPDTRGQWVEIANVGDETLQLEGLHVVNRQLDDTNETDTIIRAKHELAPGGYFVVGKFPRLARWLAHREWAAARQKAGTP